MTALRVFSIACGLGEPVPTPVKGPDFSNVDFGPLAVVEGGKLRWLARFGGRVVIGAHCVTLVESGGDVSLLVWRADEVRWSPEGREITYFGPPDSDPVTIQDGDEVILGGGGFSPEESGRPEPRGVQERPAPPHESCPKRIWFVHSFGESE